MASAFATLPPILCPIYGTRPMICNAVTMAFLVAPQRDVITVALRLKPTKILHHNNQYLNFILVRGSL